MKKILKEIQSASSAREWILENKAAPPGFKATRRASGTTSSRSRPPAAEIDDVD